MAAGRVLEQEHDRGEREICGGGIVGEKGVEAAGRR